MRKTEWEDAVEPLIGVTMEDGRIVIRPQGLLDQAALDALQRLVDGARVAGATPVVDLTGVDPRGEIVDALGAGEVADRPLGCDGSRARALPDAVARGTVDDRQVIVHHRRRG